LLSHYPSEQTNTCKSHYGNNGTPGPNHEPHEAPVKFPRLDFDGPQIPLTTWMMKLFQARKFPAIKSMLIFASLSLMLALLNHLCLERDSIALLRCHSTCFRSFTEQNTSQSATASPWPMPLFSTSDAITSAEYHAQLAKMAGLKSTPPNPNIHTARDIALQLSCCKPQLQCVGDLSSLIETATIPYQTPSSRQ